MVGLGSAGGDLRTPQFNGSNYDFWSLKMETILVAYDLWDAVEIGIQPQPIIEQEAGSEGTGDEESEAEQILVEAPTLVKKTPCVTKFCATKNYSSRKVLRDQILRDGK
ncbi:hypothetical protein L3X38_027195 [Prunus dulcis]|uniref:DUF4219 domain-containing protein n=1 Tax=Prunus dulcis TaxID=3755 RepID=A0AAD4VNZ5_PRUDU|nr:hypothetical protein L3X38_027195 [Prunus dulcis]